MINCKPIDSEVQKTLIEKIKMSQRKEFPAGEPLSSTQKFNYLQTRTSWARMISLSSPKDLPNTPVVISAGEEIIGEMGGGEEMPLTVNKVIQNKLTNTFKKATETVTGTTSKINGIIAGKFQDIYQTDNYNRPIAGLKSINTKIQSSAKAIVSADIKWVCWDFDTLQRLTPYFLSPGASVALEFGWMWPKHIPEEFIYNNWTKLDAKSIGDITDVVRKKGKGNQDMVYGIVKNFEWTGRDDGGFDCMTEIIAPASNVFGAPLGDPEDKEAFEIPAELRNQIREQRKYLSWRESEVKDVRDDKDLQEGLKELGLIKGGEEYDNYIQNLPPKVFFQNLKEVLLNMKYIYADGGVLGAGGDADLFNMIIGEKPEYDKTIIVQKIALPTSGELDERYIGPYITYGWFEDNILNRFVSNVHGDKTLGYKIRSVTKIPGEVKDGTQYYESVKINNDSANLYTIDASEVIIPGQFPYDLDFGSVEISGYDAPPPIGEDFEQYSLKRAAFSKLLSKIRDLPSFAVTPTEETDKSEKFKVREKISRVASERQSSTENASRKGGTPPQEKGFLRHLLIHVNLIQEEMGNANTLNDGLDNLMKRISDACGGIWDFELKVAEDGMSARMVETNSVEMPVKNLLDNTSIDLGTGEIDKQYEKNPNGLMIFPTWQTNSIVYNQNMVARLPSQMATQAIYGRNLTPSEAVSEDNTLEPAAKYIGKLFNSGLHKAKENPEDKLFKGMARVLGNSDYSNFGYNAHPDKSGKIQELKVDPGNYLDGVQGSVIDIDEIIQIHTEKQIMEILEDGAPVLDAEGEEEGFVDKTWKFLKEVGTHLPGYTLTAEIFKVLGKGIATWWEDRLDYRYLYGTTGIMKPHYKNALLHFLKQTPDSIERKKDQIIPIEFEITIDGTGGIYAGEVFSSTYIPARYRDSCVFQIMDVSHTVESSGWKTRLKGIMRMDHGFGEKEPLVERLKKIQQAKPTGAKEPPYLSFAEYLSGNVGKKSPYKKAPPTEEKTLEQKIEEKEK